MNTKTVRLTLDTHEALVRYQADKQLSTATEAVEHLLAHQLTAKSAVYAEIEQVIRFINSKPPLPPLQAEWAITATIEQLDERYPDWAINYAPANILDINHLVREGYSIRRRRTPYDQSKAPKRVFVDPQEIAIIEQRQQDYIEEQDATARFQDEWEEQHERANPNGHI